MSFENIPEKLKDRNQWLVWKSCPHPDPSKKDRKVPLNVRTGNGASASSPATWASFQDVRGFLDEWQGHEHAHTDKQTGEEMTGRIMGPGFVFSKDDPFTGIDLDDCLNPDGSLEPWAADVVNSFKSWTEISPSGRGLHVIVEGEKPKGSGSKRGNIECYDQGRYFTITGNLLNGNRDISNQQETLETFLETHLGKTATQTSTAPDTGLDPETVLQRALRSKQGEKIAALLSGDNAGLPSDSEGDQSLCNMLVFYCGNVPDTETARIIDQIIRDSGRYRQKWATVHRPADGATYGQMTIEKAIAGTAKRYQTRAERMEGKAPDIKDLGLTENDILELVNKGQKGCADLFILLNRGKLCFDHTDGNWFMFWGHHWKHEEIGEPISRCNQIQFYFEYVKARIDGEVIIQAEKLKQSTNESTQQAIKTKVNSLQGQSKALGAIVRNLNTLGYRKQVVEFAAQGPDSLGITGHEWDPLPWALGVQNGVIDLRTGQLREGKPGDYLRAVSPVHYDPARTCPQFEEALTGIFNSSQEIISFVQRVFGMSLVGANVEHVLIVLHGAGRNGKDVLLSTIAHVLGGALAGPVQSELLLDQGRLRSSSGPSADIMRLRGLRIAWASETNEGRRLDAGKIKLMTGGGDLVGRAPYARREISFPQSFTLFLLTNSKPHANAEDYALWKRLKLIPFVVQFVDDPKEPNEKKRDKHLLDKLKAEAPGILNWLIKGCLEWQRIGLAPPEEVERATMQYRDEEDLLLQFVNDACLTGPEFMAGASELYDHYRKWMLDNGLKPMSGTKFGRKMGERFTKDKDRGGWNYQGIGILNNNVTSF